MKLTTRIVLHCFLFLISGKGAIAQSYLLGMCSNGGNGAGSIFSMPLDSNGFNKQNNFGFIDGYDPLYSKPVAGYNNGKLYGLTNKGGSANGGTIFEIDTASGRVLKLRDLNNSSGINPLGSFFRTPNGNLYGLAFSGGSNNLGTIFRFEPFNNTLLVKWNFNGSTGGYPRGTFVEALNDKLYALASTGGNNNSGVIFEFDPFTENYQSMVNLSTITGSLAYGEMTRGSNGKLYGVTYAGGINGLGILFEYTPGQFSATKLLDFNGTNGANPRGSMLLWQNEFYGMTSKGGTNNLGVIYKYDIVTSTYTVVHEFSSVDGANPNGGFALVNNKLVGFTSTGGAYGKGTIFEFTPFAHIFNKIYDFGGLNFKGENPYGSPYLAYNGLVYGYTSNGGYNHNGTVFKYHPLSGNVTGLADFSSKNLGSNPFSSLTYSGQNDLFYGYTTSGGLLGGGTLFKYFFFSDSIYVINNFGTSKGYFPVGKPTKHNGKFFGLTNLGGINGDGVLFEFDENSSSYYKRHEFTSNITGKQPVGSLVSYNNKLYGLTNSGGTNNGGTLFEYNPASNTTSVLINFESSLTGSFPESGGLVVNDKLFFTNSFGGLNNHGTLCTYDFLTNLLTTVSFSGPDGSLPKSPLLLATDGKIVGTAEQGGVNNFGVIFEFDRQSNTITEKHSFTGTDGKFPKGDLIEVSNGKYYGMTAYGGTTNAGVLYNYDPLNGQVVKVLDFNSSKGMNPKGALTEFNSAFVGLKEKYMTTAVMSPNPANRFVNISSEWTSIEISNLTGNVLKKESVRGKKIADVSGLPAGLYNVKITTEKNTFYNKLIKID